KLEEDQVLGDALQEIQDVVEVLRQRADVLAVQRRDERGVEGLEYLRRDLIALWLDGLEMNHLDATVREALAVGDVGEEADGPEKVLRVGLQKDVETLLLGHEPSNDGVVLHRKFLLCDSRMTIE